MEPEKKKIEKNRKSDTETQGQYKCKQCNFMFSNLGSYKDHKRKIHIEKQKPYRCNRCHKQFSKEEALKIHQQIIHSSPLINSTLEKKRFPCSICEQKFFSHEYLKKCRNTSIQEMSLVHIGMRQRRLLSLKALQMLDNA